MGAKTSDWPDQLVRTKLRPSQPRDDVIHRPRLEMTLRDGLLSHRLTLISAAAGYGKTTLLATIPAIYPDLPQTWLTLDERDNDPTLFLAYLLAALHRLNPNCGLTARTLLTDLSNPAAQTLRIVGVLVNDILETMPNPFALILDDLYLITEPIIYSALDYLIERMPSQMHLVIATRHDPPLSLSRLRARRELIELRTEDLRFTNGETTAFLNETLHLELPADDLNTLHDRTEGWPVGLCLLFESLRRLPSPTERSDFITRLSKTDRRVFDFLADEVLNRQPPPLRAFMLETSILPELTPALCRAVTGRSDAGVMLDELERRNLFVVTKDRTLATYRYHALFAEFLHHRLVREQPHQVTILHGRAAQAQTDTDRAVGHYLAAKMWEQAAQTIERVGERLLNRGLLDTLVGWIHALPSATRDAHPYLLYLLGACAWRKDEFEKARLLLERARRNFETDNDDTGQGLALSDLATCALLQGSFEDADTLIRRALAHPLSPPVRVQLLMGRAWLGLMGGDWTQAASDFEAALSVTQGSDDPDMIHVPLLYLGPFFATLPDGLEGMERLCHHTLARLGEQISLSRMAVEGQMAFIHMWRGRLQEAIAAGENTLEISRRLGGHLSWELDTTLILASIHAAQGNYAAADRFFEQMERKIKQIGLGEPFIIVYLYPQGRAYWLQNRISEARQIYVRMKMVSDTLVPPFIPVLRTTMRGLLEMADHRYAAAERSLLEAVQMERAAPPAAIFGSARLLLAYLYLKQDLPRNALAELEPLLTECKRAETPGRILQHGATAVSLLRLAVEHGVHRSYSARLLDILNVTGKLGPIPVPDTGETLTPREVEILHLIAVGYTNRAIAAQLVISESTVKSHIYHIFRKLEVTSRTQAAARARHLLPV